ncbi:MAG: T9SS type A sorting domain-containing protein [Calditrichaeota bacterium]|nr:T9SS type A sorting domain-containing protein [Calditrichota bacterium]
MRNVIISLTIINTAIIACSNLLAEIINVPDDFETIQEAVDNANDGDSILVAPGEYSQGASWMREPTDIYLIGSPNHQTIINTTEEERRTSCIYPQYADVTIENFVLLSDRSGVSAGYNRMIIRNCVFLGYHGVVTTGSRSLIIEDCVFESSGEALHISVRSNPSVIRRNLFKNYRFAIFNDSNVGVLLLNNTFVNCSYAFRTELGNHIDRIEGNIFLSGGIAVMLSGWYLEGDIDSIAENHLDISFNCIHNYETNFIASLSTFGPDGDWHRWEEFNPSPGTGMIYEDPLINDDYTLTEDSPCIDAGNPESDLDPDGTRSDIGAFYFHQCDISIEPESIEFLNLQTGTLDSAAIIIGNEGLTTLQVLSQTITLDTTAFSIGYGAGEFELEPDSTHTTWIIFSPHEQAEYQGMLEIESNDPDEDLIEVSLSGSALGIDFVENLQPGEFGFDGIYPNPFNSSTTIHFDLPISSDVSIVLIDINGRQVATLVDDHLSAGNHSLAWNAKDYPAGVYLCRMEAGVFNETRKVLLVK